MKGFKDLSQNERWRRWQMRESKSSLPALPNKVIQTLKALFTIIACVAFILCGVQYWLIKHMISTTERIRNDAFDNRFYHDPNPAWTTSYIWDNAHQSFIHNVMPVAVHSHNDYTRRIPLFEALGSGCISLEADVHLRKSDLLIGHTNKHLKREKSLNNMYLEPLQRMIHTQNVNITDGSWRGIFEKVPDQTVTLLVDFKSSGRDVFEKLNEQLEPLRALDYLTHWNGTERIMRPLTIVASGNAEFHSILAMNNTHRDIFYDAPLIFLHNVRGNDFSTNPPTYTYNISNSYYASAPWEYADFGYYADDSSPSTLDRTGGHIYQARMRGLISRYWGGSPQKNSEEIRWRGLIDAGIGIMNTDDMGMLRDRSRGMGTLAIQR